MEITNLRTPGLGDATYVLEHEGMAVVVDPQRDIDRFEAVLEQRDLELRYVLETHLHNDYVSGGPALAARHGGELVLPAASGAAYDHTPAFHQEDLPGWGGLTLRPIHTPGHTPEHTSYLVLLDGRPTAVFSGGSLLVGSSGRPDLLGPERARTLALLQYLSVNRLARLPDDTGLYPTHGEGSFCTASGAGRTTSTIGQERRENPVLQVEDKERFVKFTLSDLQPWPTYYRHMGPANLFGPEPMPETTVPELGVEDVGTRAAEVVVLDGRPRAAFAEGHVPGSVGIELGEQFGVWAGWVLDFDAPVQLVLEPGQDATEAVTQLARVGFDSVQGVLWGLDGWRAAGQPVLTFDTATVAEAASALDGDDDVQFLDVRAPGEREDVALPGAIGRYVPDLVHGAPPELDLGRPVWVACGSGYRATIAAGLLERHGVVPVVVDGGGVPDIAAERAR
jgi:hydroxyacylglutathione hydrolase